MSRQLKIVVSNQKGGVGKTTSALTLARCFAETGKKVLLLDTDSQGSVGSILRLETRGDLYGLLIDRLKFSECITPAHPNIDIICSNRRTAEAEAQLIGRDFREYALSNALEEHDAVYDVVLIDVQPAISLLQTCAVVYARNVLVPIDMDMLGLQGAVGSIESALVLKRNVRDGHDIRVIGLLPIKIDRRLSITEMALKGIEQICAKYGVREYPHVRTDQAALKASRARKFLHDFSPQSKVVEDYTLVAKAILEEFGIAADVQSQTA